LFDKSGGCSELAELAPKGERRMGANPHANGGLLLRDLRCRISATTRLRSRSPARSGRGDARHGPFIRDVMKLNLAGSGTSVSSARTRPIRTAGDVLFRSDRTLLDGRNHSDDDGSRPTAG
jgi:phosphoketolase